MDLQDRTQRYPRYVEQPRRYGRSLRDLCTEGDSLPRLIAISRDRPDPSPQQSDETPTVESIAIELLAPADSPRGGRRDKEHVAALAESCNRLPPILVHRQTMRVVDGMHRLWAKQDTGATHIDVIFFDGDAGEAFVEAVRQNGAHGLPLTRLEKRAAIARILTVRPEYSNRAVAFIAGVSATTVAAVRTTLEPRNLEGPERRRGLDGRKRPVDAKAGRRRAAAYYQQNPTASLREIAAATGITPETARIARAQSAAGVLAQTSAGAQDAGAGNLHRMATPRPVNGGPNNARAEDPDNASPALRALTADPSLRRTDAGRKLLRLLHETKAAEAALDVWISSVPQYRRQSVACLASHYARMWDSLASSLTYK